MRYEEEFLRYLQNIMADVDRRIRRGHARLNLSRAEEEKVSIVHFNKNTLVECVMARFKKSRALDIRPTFLSSAITH